MESAGIFGKLPSRGDFVSRRLPREFLDPWDSWLQQGLTTSRSTLGEQWLEHYLTSPIWRFAMTAGVCGTQSYFGLLMPSVDRVGRYFPLTVTVSAPVTAVVPADALAAGRWFDAAEALLLSVLRDDGPDFDEFDALVEQLGSALTSPESCGAVPATGTMSDTWIYEADAGQPVLQAIGILASRFLEDVAGPTSWWWTAAANATATRYIATRGLPAPDTYATMLAGQATVTQAVPEQIPEDWQRSPGATADPPPADRPATAVHYRSGDDGGAGAEWAVDTLSLEELINTPLQLRPSSSAQSVTGKVRRENEDSVLEDPERGLWVVADGMGGHAAGKTASSMIVRALREADVGSDIDIAIDVVGRTLRLVNRELRTYAQRHRDSAGLGSTVAVLLVRGATAALIWAGDTRIYRRRGQHFDQLTIDHSEYQERIERGDISSILGASHNVVTRAVGGEDVLQLSTIRQGLQADDRFLICSDGVYDDLAAFRLAELLATGTSAEACNKIIAAVMEGRATDNASAIVVDMQAQ